MTTSGEGRPNPEANEPHEADLLAPWRAIDRLDGKDAAAFDRMLSENPEIARRLDIAAEERDETVALNEALPTPTRAAMDRLFARIDADAAARAPKAVGVMRWLSQRLSLASPGQLAWGATAAAVVIALQSGLLAGAYLGTGEKTYETASAPTAEAPARPAPAPQGELRRSIAPPSPARARGATVLVAFEPTATAQQIAAALTEAKVEIVAGPKPGGVFVARVLEGEPDDVIASLKARSGVVKLVTPGEQAP